MIDLEVEFDTRAFQLAFHASPRILYGHMRTAFRRAAFSTRRKWLGETAVDVRAGRFGLRSAFRYDEVGHDLDTLEGHFGTESTAALGLEIGGRIIPRHGRYLAIPIGIALRSDGRVKPNYATPAKAARRGVKLLALKFPGEPRRLYEVRKGGRRNATGSRIAGAFTQLGGSTRRLLIPAYNLVRSITQRPVLGLRSALAENESHITEIVNEGVTNAIREAFPVREAARSIGGFLGALTFGD